HGFVELDRLAVLDQDGLYGAGHVGLDLVEHLHRLDDAQCLAGLDLLADLDEGSRSRRGRCVEGADHRRLHHVSRGQRIGDGRFADGSSWCGRSHRGRGGYRADRGGGRGGHWYGTLGYTGEANNLFAFLDLQFGEVGFLEQVDQLLDFAQIHRISLWSVMPPAVAGIEWDWSRPVTLFRSWRAAEPAGAGSPLPAPARSWRPRNRRSRQVPGRRGANGGGMARERTRWTGAPR